MATHQLAALGAFLSALLLASPLNSTEVKETDVCVKDDVDGCSIPFNLPFFFKGLFTHSCNRHDICYHCGVAYNITRSVCDMSFRNDMMQTCRGKYLNLTGDGDNTESPQPHKQRVLQILAANDQRFQDIFMKELSAFLLKFGSRVQTKDFLNQFVILHVENVVGEWAMTLYDLLWEQDKPAVDTVKNISNRNWPGMSGYSSLKSEIHPPEKSSRYFIKSIWRGMVALLNKRKSDLLERSSANLQTRASESRWKKQVRCTSILKLLQLRTPDKWSQKNMQCDDINLLVCTFFSYLYYLAVHLFSEPYYLINPVSYCHDTFVLQCLPPVI